MIKTTLRLNGLIFLCSSLLLTACGGGGGGGGFVAPVPDANQGGDDEPIFQDGPAYEQMFNEYLPLTDGSRLGYENISSNFIPPAQMDVSLVDSQNSPPVYSLGFDFQTNEMKMHVSSTPEEILIHRIVGPIDVGGYTVNSLELDEPIVLHNGQNNNKTIGADASTASFGTLPLKISYSTSPVTSVFDENYGILPTIEVNFEAELTHDVFGPLGTLNTTLELAKGIGIVRNEGNYVGESVSQNLQSLTGLPQTIWFENNAGTPILHGNSDDLVRISDGYKLLPSLYELLNSDEIEALGWINVREDTASDSFVVEMNSASNLPTTLTSVELVFERKSDQLRMSGNVTLIPQI